VETDLLPYCDEIMQLLIHNLGSNEVHRSIKPQVSMRAVSCASSVCLPLRCCAWFKLATAEYA
jgi:hypothetical protein